VPDRADALRGELVVRDEVCDRESAGDRCLAGELLRNPVLAAAAAVRRKVDRRADSLVGRGDYAFGVWLDHADRLSAGTLYALSIGNGEIMIDVQPAERSAPRHADLVDERIVL